MVKIAYVYYNISSMTSSGNSTNVLTFVENVNSTLNGLPMLLVMIAIYVVLFLALTGKGFNPFKSFAATSFAVMVLAFIVYPMELIAGKTLILFCILVPISVFVLWVWGGSEFS